MILAICATWARTKRVINADDWFYGMLLGAFEIILELSVLWLR